MEKEEKRTRLLPITRIFRESFPSTQSTIRINVPKEYRFSSEIWSTSGFFWDTKNKRLLESAIDFWMALMETARDASISSLMVGKTTRDRVTRRGRRKVSLLVIAGILPPFRLDCETCYSALVSADFLVVDFLAVVFLGALFLGAGFSSSGSSSAFSATTAASFLAFSPLLARRNS